MNSKIFYYSIILILVFASKVLEAKDFRIGFMAGANSAVNSYDLQGAIQGFDSKLGYNVNTFARFTIGSLVFQPEIGYYNNRVGFKIQESTITSEINYSLGKAYGSTLLGLKLGNIRMMFGPTVYADAVENFQAFSGSKASINSTITSPQLQWGGQAGLGLDISKKWSIDARFLKVFTKSQYEAKTTSTTSPIEGSLGTVSLSLGYAIFKL